MKCSVKGCDRTDLAPHPRGGLTDKCGWHTYDYLECDCCGALYISSLADTDRMPVTDVQRRENGSDFVGFPVCEDCKDHRHGDCHEEDEEISEHVSA